VTVTVFTKAAGQVVYPGATAVAVEELGDLAHGGRPGIVVLDEHDVSLGWIALAELVGYSLDPAQEDAGQ
jgi:hypothetical protein